MAIHPFISKLVLTAFVLAALLGVYGMVSLSHHEHSGCSSPTQHTLCATPLEHLGHWQGVFTAIFAEILALFVLVALYFTYTSLTVDSLKSALWNYRKKVLLRPTLLQELFSQGILHRKEPQTA